MLRVAIVLGAAASVASAAPPKQLAPERTTLLGGRVTLQLVDGMVARADGSGADLDWGDARFTLTASERPGVHELPFVRLAGDVARVERIAVGKSWRAIVVQPRVPRRVGGRATLLVVHAVDVRGDGVDLELSISDAGFDDAAAWAVLARRCVATLTAASEVVVAPLRPGGPVPTRFGDAKRYCDIHDNELDVHPVGRNSTDDVVDGKLRGREVYWFVWTDKAGAHAEVITRAAKWGILHVVCHAPTAKGLAAIRRVAETLLSAGDADTPPPAAEP